MGRKANQPILFNKVNALFIASCLHRLPNDLLGCWVIENLGYTVYVPVLSGHGTGDVCEVLQVPVVKWLEESRWAFAFLKQAGMTEVAVFGLSRVASLQQF